LAKDYLSELFKSVYTDTVFEWKKQGLSDQDIINKLSQDTINDSLKAVLEQSAKDYRDFFVAKKFEIAHRQKIETDKFIAHHNEIWGDCFAVSETMYVINATRCLLSDNIDLPMYFRICHTITHTLDEDLTFLSEKINESDLTYSPYIQGLLTSGLMYQSVIDANGEQKYSFTPLAEFIDRYAVSYNNIERYPITLRCITTVPAPQPKLPGIPEWEEISEKDIEEIFKK